MLFAGGSVVFAAVMAIAAYAAFGSQKSRLSSRALIVVGGIVFPALTLFALLLYSLTRAAALHPAEPAALRIEVTGEQWWWRVAGR